MKRLFLCNFCFVVRDEDFSVCVCVCSDFLFLIWFMGCFVFFLFFEFFIKDLVGIM